MPVVVRCGGQEVTVHALLDCGSTASFCDRKLMEILQATRYPKLLCLGLSSNGDTQWCQLHYFADASITAYGVVCFSRSVDNDNNIFCSFINVEVSSSPAG